MKKLGLFAYENDSKPTDKKFAYIIDESIMVNREKLAAFMDGDIQDCIDHLIVAENAERLKESEL